MAIPALAQAPASSWANVSTVSAKGVDAVGAPSLAVVGGAVDLGDVDGDRPVLGRIVIENRGAFPFSLLVPGLAATPLRVQFPSAEPVSIPPGGKLEMPIEYDARLDDGAGSFEVNLDTNDPGAPQLRQLFTLNAPHQAMVAPYRDLLTSVDAPVKFIFAPSAGGKFVSAVIEDAAAPVVLSVTAGEAGDMAGTATLDATKLSTCAPQGSVRVLGTMGNGRTAYFWLQWIK